MLCFTLPSGSDPQSLQVAVSPCCIQVLPSVIPQIFPRIPGPLPRWLTRCAYPFLPLSHRPSPNSHWVGCSTRVRSTTSERGVLRGCSHSIIFRPPSLLPPRSFPPLASNTGARAAVAFTSEQNAVRCLPAHRICWPSEFGQLTAEVFHLLDLQPCWLLRSKRDESARLIRPSSLVSCSI